MPHCPAMARAQRLLPLPITPKSKMPFGRSWANDASKKRALSQGHPVLHSFEASHGIEIGSALFKTQGFGAPKGGMLGGQHAANIVSFQSRAAGINACQWGNPNPFPRPQIYPESDRNSILNFKRGASARKLLKGIFVSSIWSPRHRIKPPIQARP